MHSQARVRPWRNAAFAGFLVAYFLYFNREALRAPFAADDMMNLAEHWRRGPWQLLSANVLIWRDLYRPMGGLFYVPVFLAFGLNPVAYHAASLALVLIFVGLIYRLARLLGSTALEAWLAALIVAYHAGLANLYYETSHVYDVLCGLFFAAALICYLRARTHNRPLRRTETAAFFVLFLCSLNSKEMAVTLPAILLAYECFYHGRPGRRTLWIPLVAAVVTAVYLYGRVLGGLARSRATTSRTRWRASAVFSGRNSRICFFSGSTTDGSPSCCCGS